MTDDIERYLETINATRVIRSRVEEIRRAYKALVPGADLDHAIISETTDGDGQRVYKSLWLYDENYLCEATDFLTGTDLDVIFWGGVTYARLKTSEFDLGDSPTSRSRVNFRFSLAAGQATIDGSGENCQAVMDFVTQTVLPRLTPPTSSEAERL